MKISFKFKVYKDCIAINKRPFSQELLPTFHNAKIPIINLTSFILQDNYQPPDNHHPCEQCCTICNPHPQTLSKTPSQKVMQLCSLNQGKDTGTRSIFQSLPVKRQNQHHAPYCQLLGRGFNGHNRCNTSVFPHQPNTWTFYLRSYTVHQREVYTIFVFRTSF